MKKKKYIVLGLAFVLLAALIVGCSSKSEDSAGFATMDSYQKSYSENAPSPARGGNDESASLSKEAVFGENSIVAPEEYSDKIIYYVNMRLVADDPEDTHNKLVEKAEALGGYISYSNMSKSGENAIYIDMQIRIPNFELDKIKDYAYEIADVEGSNMNTDNITEQYYDTMARLDHQKLQVEQLEKLMEEAKTIEDVLAVRTELSYVQENVEVYEGRIRLWNSQVDFSTVTISISPSPTLDNTSDGPRLITLGETGRAIVRAFKNSLIGAANFFSFFARVIVYLIIPAVIIVPIVFLIIFLVKRRRAKKGIVKKKNIKNQQQ